MGRHFKPQSNNPAPINGGRHFEPQSNGLTSTTGGRHFKSQDTNLNDLTKISHITRGETLQTPPHLEIDKPIDMEVDKESIDYMDEDPTVLMLREEGTY